MRHPAKRQAGFVYWAALAIMLALVPIVGVGLIKGVGILSGQQQGERAVVRFLDTSGFSHNYRVPRDSDGGESNYRRAEVLKKFEDMPERDKRYVVGGAIFVIGLVGLITYFAVEARRFRKPNQKRRKRQ